MSERESTGSRGRGSGRSINAYRSLEQREKQSNSHCMGRNANQETGSVSVPNVHEHVVRSGSGVASATEYNKWRDDVFKYESPILSSDSDSEEEETLVEDVEKEVEKLSDEDREKLAAEEAERAILIEQGCLLAADPDAFIEKIAEAIVLKDDYDHPDDRLAEVMASWIEIDVPAGQVPTHDALISKGLEALQIRVDKSKDEYKEASKALNKLGKNDKAQSAEFKKQIEEQTRVLAMLSAEHKMWSEISFSFSKIVNEELLSNSVSERPFINRVAGFYNQFKENEDEYKKVMSTQPSARILKASRICLDFRKFPKAIQHLNEEGIPDSAIGNVLDLYAVTNDDELINLCNDIYDAQTFMICFNNDNLRRLNLDCKNGEVFINKKQEDRLKDVEKLFRCDTNQLLSSKYSFLNKVSSCKSIAEFVHKNFTPDTFPWQSKPSEASITSRKATSSRYRNMSNAELDKLSRELSKKLLKLKEAEEDKTLVIDAGGSVKIDVKDDRQKREKPATLLSKLRSVVKMGGAYPKTPKPRPQEKSPLRVDVAGRTMSDLTKEEQLALTSELQSRYFVKEMTKVKSKLDKGKDPGHYADLMPVRLNYSSSSKRERVQHEQVPADLLKETASVLKDKPASGTLGAKLSASAATRPSRLAEMGMMPRIYSAPNSQINNNMRSVRDPKVASKVDKWGKNSVQANNVTRNSYGAMPPGKAQNAFQWADGHARENEERVNWDVDDLGFFVCTQITNPVKSRVRRFEAVTGKFSRFYDPVEQRPQVTKFRLKSPKVRYRMDESKLAEFRQGALLRTKSSMDTMQATFHIGRMCAEALVPYLDLNLNIFDNRYFFLLGAVQAMTLQDHENVQRPLVVGDVPQGAVQMIDITSNDGMNAAQQVGNAVTDGRFMIEGERLTNTDLLCIKALAGGSNGLRGEANDGVHHIFRSFDMPGIRFAVVNRGVRNLPNDQHVISSSDMFNFLKKMASSSVMKTDFVRGFTLAQTVMNGQVRTINGVTYFMDSLLQVGSLCLPMPRGTNYLWLMMGFAGDEPDLTPFRDEFMYLNNVNIDQVQRAGALIAACQSIAMSTILQRFSIGGRELNAVRAMDGQSANVIPFLRNLFNIQEDYDRAIIFPMISQFISEVSGCMLNSDAYAGMEWCDALRELPAQLHARDLWRGVWGRDTPYMIDPLCISQFLDSLPSQWALSEPNMGLDLTAETVKTGMIINQAWYSELGTDEFEENLRNGTLQNNAEYGRSVVNFLIQTLSLQVGEIQVEHNRYAVAQKAKMLIGVDAEPDQLRYRGIQDGIPRIREGCGNSFDWNTLEMRAIMIPLTAVNGRVSLLIRQCKIDDSDEAGIVREKSMFQGKAPIDYDMTDAIPGMVGYKLRAGVKDLAGDNPTPKNLFGSRFMGRKK